MRECLLEFSPRSRSKSRGVLLSNSAIHLRHRRLSRRCAQLLHGASPDSAVAAKHGLFDRSFARAQFGRDLGFLNQVLGCVGIMSLPADEGVERIPIGAAQFL